MTISRSPGKVWYDSGMSVTQCCLAYLWVFFSDCLEWLFELPLKNRQRISIIYLQLLVLGTLIAVFTISNILNGNIWEKVHYSQRLFLGRFMVNQYFFLRNEYMPER